MAIWGIGNLIWFYYNISGVETPYPSLADVGYLGMIPFAAAGLFIMLRGVKTDVDSRTLLKLAVLPGIVFAMVYIFFIQSKLAENTSTLLMALNIAYPVGDMIFLSLALMILSVVKGSKFSKPIAIICAGFIIEAFADFSFSWTATAGTYAVGGWVDILFVLAFSVIGIGMHYIKNINR